MTAIKNKLGGTAIATVLIALVLLLAWDAGLWLYNPSRFAAVLSSCALNILHGTAEVQTPDTITWEEAKDGMKLEPGSRVSTGADSHVLLTFSEGTTTKLEPDTDVLVAKLESDVITLRQQSGRTWNQVTKLSDNRHHFEIQTPSANVMARGTLFLVNVDASGKTFAQTTAGQVDVVAQGRTVNVFPGQQTEVKPGVHPSVPVPIPPARNELTVTVGAPAVGMVIDPHGASTGFLPGGSALNQVAGSRSSVQEQSRQVIVIPELSSGEYAVVLRGVDEGNADYSIEAIGDGKSVFKYAGSYNATAADEWLLLLHVNIVGGLLQGVSIVDPRSPGDKSTGDTTKTGARSTEIEALGPPTNHPNSDIAWPSVWDKVRSFGYWAAVAILVIFLTLIFARPSRQR